MATDEHCSRLVRLCRQLLEQNERLSTRLDRLYGEARQICIAYRELRERADREHDSHSVQTAASEVLLAEALDQLQERDAA
jgi:hypothetical protein